MEQTATVERANKLVELVTFFLGGSLYGIDILKVQEINKIKEWTVVPNSEDFVKGILSLRGSIVTILDLGKKLGLTETQVTENTRNIIINSKGQQGVGFMVEGIGSVTNVNWDLVCDPPPNMNGVQGRFLEGVLKTENDLIAILDVNEVFSDGNETKSQES
ncbi:chemotaxis protein CheW [Planctomycetota bacterium]